MTYTTHQTTNPDRPWQVKYAGRVVASVETQAEAEALAEKWNAAARERAA